jgi:hypothetical protein
MTARGEDFDIAEAAMAMVAGGGVTLRARHLTANAQRQKANAWPETIAFLGYCNPKVRFRALP